MYIYEISTPPIKLEKSIHSFMCTMKNSLFWFTLINNRIKLITLYHFIKKNFSYSEEIRKRYIIFTIIMVSPKFLQDYIQYHFDHENRRGRGEKDIGTLMIRAYFNVVRMRRVISEEGKTTIIWCEWCRHWDSRVWVAHWIHNSLSTSVYLVRRCSPRSQVK